MKKLNVRAMNVPIFLQLLCVCACVQAASGATCSDIKQAYKGQSCCSNQNLSSPVPVAAFNSACWDTDDCDFNLVTPITIVKLATAFTFQANMGPFRQISDTEVILPVETEVSNMWGDGLTNHIKSSVQYPRHPMGSNYAFFGVGGEPLSSVPPVTDEDIFHYITSESLALQYTAGALAFRQMNTTHPPTSTTEHYLRSPSPTGSAACLHLTNPLNSTNLPLNTSMAFVSTSGYRFGLDTGTDIDSMIGRMQLTIVGDDLIATMVFDLKTLFSVTAAHTQSVTLSYTGDLVGIPQALFVNIRGSNVVTIVNMSCDEAPSRLSRGRPGPNMTLLATGKIARSNESTSQQDEMSLVKMALRCWDYGQVARKYAGAIGGMASTTHGFHDSYLNPQDLKWFAGFLSDRVIF